MKGGEIGAIVRPSFRKPKKQVTLKLDPDVWNIIARPVPAGIRASMMFCARRPILPSRDKRGVISSNDWQVPVNA
jgi:hypothetical protein